MSYGHDIPRELQYNGTRIINACQRYAFEIPDQAVKPKHLDQVIYKTRQDKSSHT